MDQITKKSTSGFELASLVFLVLTVAMAIVDGILLYSGGHTVKTNSDELAGLGNFYIFAFCLIVTAVFLILTIIFAIISFFNKKTQPQITSNGSAPGSPFKAAIITFSIIMICIIAFILFFH